MTQVVVVVVAAICFQCDRQDSSYLELTQANDACCCEAWGNSLTSFPKDGEVSCVVRPPRSETHPEFDVTRPSFTSIT